MEFKKELLEQVAKDGAVGAAEAFSKLLKQETLVESSDVQSVSLAEAYAVLKPSQKHAIVVYSQVIAGLPVKGVSFLTIDRDQALVLVDALNQRASGTTGILKDIDRSAIKETLNILSNAFLNALAVISEIELGLGAPTMITSARLDDVVDFNMKTTDPTEELAVIFKTVIRTQEILIETNLFLIFSEELYKSMVQATV
mgnify:CR=1 FL=1|jgi:chemotaxis protein CheY-P-specific phosphatase CheC